MYNIAPFILKRKIPDVSEILMHRAFLKGNEKLGRGTGCLGDREGGRLKKNYIFFGTFQILAIFRYYNFFFKNPGYKNSISKNLKFYFQQ